MISEKINIVITDDDKADCLLFKKALRYLPVSAMLTIVHKMFSEMQLIITSVSRLPIFCN